jgi:hypothetical protein
MALTIACLHTAATNAVLFDTAAAALPGGALRLIHRARPDLLRTPDDATLDEAAALLAEMSEGADAVLLTCSTIGEAVERVQGTTVPVLRADAALAHAAMRAGGDVTVLYAAPSSRGPTFRLFDAVARAQGARMRLDIVPGAWALFEAGDLLGYHARIADMARGALGRVALAQASMAPAAALLPHAPPLTVPGTGVMAAARAAVDAKRRRA